MTEDDDWMFTAMVGLGLNANPPSGDRVEPLVQGRVGLLRRLAGPLEARLGVAYLPAGVAGPALVFDVMDVAALQAGWMVDAGVLLSLEVTAALVCDLFC